MKLYEIVSNRRLKLNIKKTIFFEIFISSLLVPAISLEVLEFSFNLMKFCFVEFPGFREFLEFLELHSIQFNLKQKRNVGITFV